ncbi:hypothetical protein [Streptomyces sp. NPDC048191]|uniref:hypothetical protein n=1 Tax=Streptomyces sp. NPDC048191 TaxID=3155484 RepID=UPI0033DDF2C2
MSEFLDPGSGRAGRDPGEEYARRPRHAGVRWRCAGRFATARQTLAALGSLYGAGAAEWACHRQPGPGTGGRPAYWLLTTLPGPAAADVIALHGGRPVPLDSPHSQGAEELRSWPEVTAVELLAAFPTHDPPSTGHALLYVLTAPALLATVVRLAQSARADVTFVRTRSRPLFPDTRPAPAEDRLLVLLRAFAVPDAPEAERAIPGGLVHSLLSLPRTSVCRPAAHCARLLLEVRLDAPLDEELLRPAVDEGELWLLGDSGEQPPVALRLLSAPAPLDVQGPPDTPAPLAPPAGPPAVPPEVRLRVVPHLDAATGVDAVLLTDAELPLLRRLLPGRPLAERAFLAVGDGVQLLVDATGLVASVPFGVPLRRVGPGACYVQSGFELVPALPAGARIRALGLRAGLAVVCWQGGRSVFALDPLVPVWTLWSPPEPPPADPGLSEVALELLTAFEQLTAHQPDAPTVSDGPPLPPDPAGEDVAPALGRAARLRAEGHLLEAAEAYRSAGDPMEAGRLFEQAAQRLEDAE